MNQYCSLSPLLQQQTRVECTPYLLDPVQELGPDDASTLPDARQLAQVEVPVLLHALGADDVHALRVTADLGRIQRLQENREFSSAILSGWKGNHEKQLV